MGMKQAIKGAFLSGLVFPGLGQLALGQRKLGGGIILLTTASLVALVVGLSQRLPAMLAQLQPEVDKGSLTLDRIIEVSLGSSTGGGGGLESVATLLLVGCWLGSVGHAFWLGLRGEHR